MSMIESKDKIGKNFWIYAFALLALSNCSTANHGTFATSTFFDQNEEYDREFLGTVVGESSQTWFFYVFPVGDAPSTAKAMSAAKAKIQGTKHLTDLSIDDRMFWKIGYSEQIIRAEADAYK